MFKEIEKGSKNLRGIGCATLIVLALGAQSAAANEAQLTLDTVKQSNNDYVAAVLGGDLESIQYRYSSDAILIGHGGMLLKGRAALNDHYIKALKVRPKSATVTTLSLEKAGDKYIEVGESRGEGASGSSWRGHYMSIWEHQNGQWLIKKNIYN